MQAATTPVLFGYFSTALLATAAVAFAAGVQFLLIGLRQKSDRTPLAFALLCLCATMLAVGRVATYTSTSLGQAILALRVVVGAALFALPALMLFVAGYTARPVRRYVLAAAVLASLILFALNLVEPYTVLDSSLGEGQHLVLPWGERLFAFDSTQSVSGHLFYCYSYAVFAWALYRGVRQYRDGQRLRAVALLACLLLQLLALLWGAIMVDTLGKPYPTADAFAFMSFVLLMGLSLVSQMHTRTAQLERTTAELRTEAATRRQAEQELRHAAWHDALTGLPNRLRAQHLLTGMLLDAERDGRHGAVLLIDLDNFKTINDSLGHHVGDLVLGAIADRLLAVVPDVATVVRLGGDEFAVLLDIAADSADQACAGGLRVAERILGNLASPLTLDGRVLSAGASIGVATFPEAGMHAADIIRRADIALYRAKAAGRHTVRRFEPQMQREADTRLDLERGLRTALERDELSMHFQPQVDMAGRVVGAEALLRWQHPQLGPVPPAIFIPIAEETGLIHTLGTWVIATACRHLGEWQGLGVGHGLHLSVNVSAWQIAHPQFVDAIAAQVRATGIEPAALTLELTESALLDDFEAAQRTLYRLSTAGFRLSLDDFGTGYSSLSYLQQLPLDELKVDRSFVGSLQSDAYDPLTSFIIDVGQRLGMITVAEGVETVRQKTLLAALGCDVMQGNLISPPLDATDFQRWLVARAQADAASGGDAAEGHAAVT
jgi:diguanylate cyclase (GGDEF)-like protein